MIFELFLFRFEFELEKDVFCVYILWCLIGLLNEIFEIFWVLDDFDFFILLNMYVKWVFWIVEFLYILFRVDMYDRWLKFELVFILFVLDLLLKKIEIWWGLRDEICFEVWNFFYFFLWFILFVELIFVI